MKTITLDSFKRSSERIKNIEKHREEAATANLKYGIDYLDKSLGGINPKDLVLIGAKPGQGKTELASHIAMTNVKAGKRVYVFSLEEIEDGVELRIAYKFLARKYYLAGNKEPIRYQDWLQKRVDLSQYEDESEFKHLENLYTFYKSNQFGMRELTAELNALKDRADLIILDHIHYMDIDEDRQNTELKEIVKTISDIIKLTNIPIICVAHLRKSNNHGSKKDMPEIEDFHGTSDLTKIASKVIILQGGKQSSEDYTFNTFIHIAKNRTAGDVTRFAAVMKFDPYRNEYLKECAICKIADGKLDNLSHNNWPSWLK